MKLAFIPNCLKIILFRDSVEEYLEASRAEIALLVVHSKNGGIGYEVFILCFIHL